MRTGVVIVALILTALLAGRASAKKYDAFQLKEMREEREQRKEDKAGLERDRQDELEAQHAKERQMGGRHGDDADAELDVDIDRALDVE